MTIEAETLKAMIADDGLGLLDLPVKPQVITKDERLVASFDEITEFVREHGREPANEGGDVAEMKLFFRLEGIRVNDHQLEELAPHDELGLLHEPEPPASLEEAAADDPLGLLDGPDINIYEGRHVPTEPVTQPDKIAQRKPCVDFERFEPLFKQCHAELQAGIRKLVTFRNEQEIRVDAFYVHRGILTYVAAEGERRKERGRINARLRCIFENGTEADLLLRSFASQLYRFGKQVTDPVEKTNEALQVQLDGQTGYVYVLRSLSDDPQVTGVPDLHKIGFTTLTMAQRTSGAKKHTTFLGAGVKEVATYEMPASMARGVEKLLHRFFGAARVEAWFEQRGVTTAEINEWFSVPLEQVDKAIELLQAESIENYEYDVDARAITLRT
jgi:hypothetical protein